MSVGHIFSVQIQEKVSEGCILTFRAPVVKPSSIRPIVSIQYRLVTDGQMNHKTTAYTALARHRAVKTEPLGMTATDSHLYCYPANSVIF